MFADSEYPIPWPNPTKSRPILSSPRSRHSKAAGDAFDIAYDVAESAPARNKPAAEHACRVASDALAAARETILNVPPTTIEGLAALLIFISNEPDIAEWLIHASDHVEAMRFFHMLARSVCALSGLPEPPTPGALVIPLRSKT